MVILVSGSVGTGKTSISRLIAKKLNLEYLDVNKIIKDLKLRERYLKKLDTYEVNIDKLNEVLIKIIKNNKNLIIDSHLSHYLPSNYFDYCIICKCDIKILKNRLKKRKYSEVKIRENLDSEIFDVCLVEALENKHKVIVINTDKKTISACVDEILKKIK